MEGDAARIHQLVSLLVDNAVKYTPEGGKNPHFLAKKRQKSRIFGAEYLRYPAERMISTIPLTASTVRMRRGPGKAAAMESAFPWQLQL